MKVFKYLFTSFVLVTSFIFFSLSVLAVDITIDDGDAEYSEIGTWLTGSGPYRYSATGSGTDVATWTPDVPATGLYEVMVSWYIHPNRATDAPYTVNHANGTTTIDVNQEVLADGSSGPDLTFSGWYSLGTYTFNIGTGGSVELSDEADEIVVADQVRLVPKATLTINKVVDPADDLGLFDLQIDSSTVLTDATNGSSTSTVLEVGTYVVGEVAGTGTDLNDYVSVISGDCATNGTVSLNNGDNKTCTITNTRRGSITVIKQTLPDGDPATFDFTGAIVATLGDGDSASADVDPGTYSVSETVPNAWALSSAVCDDGSDPSSIVVDPGESVTCTFTNSKHGQLTIVKNTIGGDGTFDFSGPGFQESFQLSTNSGTASTTFSIPAGDSYEVTEDDKNGWQKTQEPVCSGTMNAGAEITCTYENTKLPTLTITKTSIGGDGTFDFDGPTSTSFELTTVSGTASNIFELAVGENYSVTENVPTGWELTDANPVNCSGTAQAGDELECTFENSKLPTLTVIKEVINDNGGNALAGDFNLYIDGSPVISGATTTVALGAHSVSEDEDSAYTATIGGACSSDGDIILVAGEEAVCTITNDDEPARIQLIKEVINDNGGDASPEDFELLVDGNPVVSGATTTVDSNIPIEITELSLTGYSFDNIHGDAKCPVNLGDTVTLDEGEGITCYLVNDDIAPTITLIKSVTNNNGGTAGVNDFGLNIGGTPVDSSETLIVDANTLISIDEDGLFGYEFVEITGVGCPANLGDSVTLDEGEDLVCTIINDDQPGQLTVYKNTVNNNGGNATPGDFTITVTGINPNPPSFSGTPTGTVVLLDAGNYSVGETGPSGYAMIFTGECDSSIDIGEQKTCEITNDDQAPILTVQKIVLNDDGGTLTVDDFILKVDNLVVNHNATNTLDVGLHTVSEDPVFGYEGTIGGDCNSQGEVQLNPGDEKTCTITNRDIQPTLTVTKVVINNNGGSGIPGIFDIKVNGTEVISGAENGFDAGDFIVSEEPHPGYVGVISGDCDANGNVSLSIGETKECIITNDDIAPQLTVIKQVINDNGGTLTPGDFNMIVGGNNVLPANQFPGNASGTVVTLDAGSVSVSEDLVPGYSQSLSGNCSGTIPSGAEWTCTLTNDDIAPTIILNKEVWNDHGGAAVPGIFDLTLDGQIVPQGVPQEVNANVPIEINELSLTGYSFVSFGGNQKCPNNLGDSVTLDPGEDITCNVINDDDPASLHGQKFNDTNGDGVKDQGELGLENWTIGLYDQLDNFISSTTTDQDGNYWFIDLAVGNYRVKEVQQSGWLQTFPTTPIYHDVSVSNGESVEDLDFGNVAEATIIIEKQTLPDGEPDDFTFSGDVSGNIGDGEQIVVSGLLPGQYTSTEDVLTGWDLTDIVCDPGASGDIGTATATFNVEAGDDLKCTFENTQRSTLTVKKTTDPFGDLQEFDIEITGTGTVFGSPTGIVTDTLDYEYSLTTGTYDVVETLPAGWIETSNTCLNKTVNPGSNSSCTIKNTKLGTIIIEKQTDPADDPTQFTFSGDVSGDIVDNGQIVVNGLEPGVYISTESIPVGWDLTNISCDDNNSSGDTGSGEATFNLEAGETIKCTYTNTKKGKIVIEKQTLLDGDTEIFEFTGDLTVSLSDGQTDELEVEPGQYSVAETVPVGWDLTSISCDDTNSTHSTSTATATFEVEAGETVTCVFENTKHGQLTIEKNAVGGDDLFQFNGPTSTSFFIDTISGSGSETFELSAGTNYDVSEINIPTGWDLTGDPQCSGTMSPGEEVTCTFENTKIPTLTVNKIVENNNGGQAVIGDFELFIGGNQVTSGDIVPVSIGGHVISENQLSGYVGVIGGDCDANGDVTLAAGEDKTCTITNSDQPGELSGQKFEDLNNNGIKDLGEPGLEGWRIKLRDPDNGNQVIQTVFTDSDGKYSFTGLSADNYRLTEVLKAGWIRTTPVSPNRHDVNLANGEAIEDLDFGNFKLGEIHGQKFNDLNGDSIKDQGEPGLVDWTINITGPNGFATSTITDVDGNYWFMDLVPGDYEVSEEQQPGWEQSFPISDSRNLSIVTSGQVLEDNDFGNFQLPTLTVIKEVTNDDGGTAIIFDFNLYIDGNNATSSEAVILTTGSHIVSEDQLSGYSGVIGGDCDVNGNVTLGPGENKTCTITNDDIAPSIALIKEVINDDGGQAGENDFGLTIGGTSVDSGQTLEVTADIPIELNELQLTGYSFVEITGINCPASLGDTVTLAPGEELECTITNDDEPARIQLIKEVINDDGGNALPEDFELFVGGSPVVSGTTTTVDANIPVEITELELTGYSFNNIHGDAKCPVNLGDTVTLDEGEGITCYLVNDDEAGSLHGMKFEDINANGVKDVNEPGLEGWKIRLRDTSNNILDTIITDSDGEYSFIDLPAADYRVHEVIQPGWQRTVPVSPNRYNISLGLGEAIENLDFGNFELAQVHGFKYNDANGNTAKDNNELGLEGWTINITGPNGYASSTVTDIDGAYWFMDLGPGIYTLSEVQQPGWIQTEPSAPGNWQFSPFSGQVRENLNFGNRQLSSIHVFKYEDMHADGEFNNADLPIENWGIELYDDQNNLLDATTTNASGLAWFMDLPAGDYEVREVMQPDWFASTPTTSSVLLDGSGSSADIEFGNYQKGVIRGRKFSDDNGDGVKDPLEDWLSDWTIELWQDGNLLATTTTATNGLYIFDELEPGQYQVYEVQQIGWTQTAPVAGFFTLNVKSGQTKGGKHFGNQPQTVISGVKYEDINGNGIRDIDPETQEFIEPGLPGWTIRLKQNGSTIHSTTTDELGRYVLEAVNGPGEYQVRETMQSGWTQTSLPIVYTVDIAAGEIIEDIDFGNFQLAEIHGIKYEDINGNGRHDNDEPLLSGWTIELYDGDDNFLESTTTNELGEYWFMDLEPRDYQVKEIITPAGAEVLVDDGDPGYSDTLWSVANNQGNDSDVHYIAAGTGSETATWTPDLPSTGEFEVFVSWTTHPNRATDAPYTVNYDGGSQTIDVNQELLADQATVGGSGELSGWFSLGMFDFLAGSSGNVVLSNDANEYVIADSVRFVATAVWEQSQPGADNDYRYEFTIDTSASEMVDANFGNYQPAEMVVRKFRDENFNGTRQPGEEWLAGWEITIHHLGTGEVLQQTTNSNGKAKFKSIRPGKYLVRENMQGGWIPFSPPVLVVDIFSNQQLSGIRFANEEIANLIAFNILNDTQIVPLTFEVPVPLGQDLPDSLPSIHSEPIIETSQAGPAPSDLIPELPDVEQIIGRTRNRVNSAIENLGRRRRR